ncbi:hypothetical protein [Micromonospora eburnea]|uniref:hypothetical protein n=1 Tax=Micromonospora eburnea TaxID=227316 RepID=UPI000B872BB7|nr:hypothetical protein [Micromonospora eburnea]
MHQSADWLERIGAAFAYCNVSTLVVWGPGVLHGQQLTGEFGGGPGGEAPLTPAELAAWSRLVNELRASGDCDEHA